MNVTVSLWTVAAINASAVHIVRTVAKVANMAICGCVVVHFKRGLEMHFVVHI